MMGSASPRAFRSADHNTDGADCGHRMPDGTGIGRCLDVFNQGPAQRGRKSVEAVVKPLFAVEPVEKRAPSCRCSLVKPRRMERGSVLRSCGYSSLAAMEVGLS